MTTLSRLSRAAETTSITIREHRIPSADSKPYIAVEGPDGALWFCESGASKIGRLDPDRGTFTEFALPTAKATPIGITRRRRRSVVRRKGREQDRLHHLRGEITEFALPTPGAGPDGMILGPDGNVWFSETEVSRIGRITPDGASPNSPRASRPARSRCRSWCATARCGSGEAAGNRVGRITVDGKVSEFQIPAMTASRAPWSASRRQHLVRRDLDQCARPRRSRGRITDIRCRRERVAARRHRRRRRRLWYTANFANKIGCMAPDGTVIGEYGSRRRTAARAASPRADGRLFFTLRRRCDRRSGRRIRWISAASSAGCGGFTQLCG